MLSTTTEEESDASPFRPKRKHCRQRMISSSPSSDSDESVIVTTRRRRCRVTSSSSESDDSIFARPSKKKCKVLPETESDPSETSESEEEHLQRRQDKRPKKRTLLSDTEATSGEEAPLPKKTQVDINSSDSEEGEPCIICFKNLRPPFARPSNCVHNFHPICLSTWSKTSNTCPIDRVIYTAIHVVDSKGELISKEEVSTPPPQDHNADFEPDDATFCEVCSQHDREHEMLLCDRCEAGYHLDCLNPPLHEVPEGNWYCPHCSELDLELAEEMAELMDDAAVILETRMRERPHSHARMPRGAHPRTRGAQRVFNIIHSRDASGQPSTSSEITISSSRHPMPSHRRVPSSRRTASRRRTTSSRRSQSTKYKVELVTVEDGTTLEVKVAVNTRTRRKSKKHSRRKSKKKCSRSSRRSGHSSRSAESSLMGEGPSHSLDLFGSRPQLEYFSGCEAEDELDEDRSGRSDLAALRRGSQPVARNMASRKQIAARVLNASSRRTPKIEQSSAPVDLVSSILEQQEKWHSRHASYESTSNGDIRVVLKDSSSRTQGGSSSSSSSTRAESSSRPQPSTSGVSRPASSGSGTSCVPSSSSSHAKRSAYKAPSH